MKKLVLAAGLVAAALLCSSCVHDCSCTSTNIITQNDSIISSISDTVTNSTREDCSDLNKDTVFNYIDNTTIRNIVICK